MSNDRRDMASSFLSLSLSLSLSRSFVLFLSFASAFLGKATFDT